QATRFFAADTGRALRRWDQERGVGDMAFSPDGKTLAQVISGRIHFRDVATGKAVPPVQALPAYVMTVGFAADGWTRFTSCADGRTAWWDPLSGKQQTPLQAPPAEFAGRSRMLLGAAFTAAAKKAALVDATGR